MSDLESEVAELYALHAGELLDYAALILRERADAADAVQEVFLRYFALRNCGGVIENPRPWFYRVLYNHILHCLERAARLEISAEAIPDACDPALDPEERLARRQTANQMAADFTARELDCVHLRAQGFSYDETAATLGIRSGTVGALLNRVHKKLRDASGNDQAARMAIAEGLYSLLEDPLRSAWPLLHIAVRPHLHVEPLRRRRQILIEAM